jgi:DNA-directed RNA polymerase omega subunit
MEESWSQMMAEGKQKYMLINVLARRARQINEGFRPVVPGDNLDPITAALAELKADKLRVAPATKDEEEEEE